MINDPQVRVVGDLASWGVTITAILGWLPPIAALASIVWTCIQVYEWHRKRKSK